MLKIKLMRVSELKVQPINLNQGLLLSSVGQPIAGYDNYRKTIFITDSSVFLFYSVPEYMQHYKLNENYGSFSLGGWNKETDQTELI